MYVVAGPSGVGKTSVVAGLLRKVPSLMLSTSATTRAPRPNERDGVDYFFLDEGEFARREAAGGFLETAVVHGNRYGTPRGPVEEALAAGRTVILEIDAQGARSVRAAMPDAVLIFIEPPSWEILRARLEDRKTESAEALERRLKNAVEEMAAAPEFDHRVVNDELEEAVDQVIRILETTSRTDKEFS